MGIMGMRDPREPFGISFIFKIRLQFRFLINYMNGIKKTFLNLKRNYLN